MYVYIIMELLSVLCNLCNEPCMQNICYGYDNDAFRNKGIISTPAG